ncbi:hypothetical protein P4B35_08685 [Pontiellaceae bacterium B12227]|nr:hypothetical protein [Pontiellaceae bacterium B12227]
MSNIFTALNSARIASHIQSANHRVCYIAPGVQCVVAAALVDAAQRIDREKITVSIDLDERVMRMGYGDIDGVSKLHEAGVYLHDSPGLRTAVLIVDATGYIFTPTAEYLEVEPQSEETPNAIQMSPEQIHQVIIRLSPKEKEEAIEKAPTEEVRQELRNTPVEVGVQAVSESKLKEVKQRLIEAPPVKFDVVRRVHVFEPYIQYIDCHLKGCHISQRRIRIPKHIMELGKDEDIAHRLHTTFDLLEKRSKASTEQIKAMVKNFLDDFTKSLGEPWKRVILRARRPQVDAAIADIQSAIEDYQEELKEKLKVEIARSMKKVVSYYIPLVKANPPARLVNQISGKLTNDICRKWLSNELARETPDAQGLIDQMKFDVQFRDVTYETLKEPAFEEALRQAYEYVDWDKPFNEFMAAGEKDDQHDT